MNVDASELGHNGRTCEQCGGKFSPRVGSGGLRTGHDPLVAGALTLDFDAAQDPYGNRVQRERRPQQTCQQIGPIVPSREMRSLYLRWMSEVARNT